MCFRPIKILNPSRSYRSDVPKYLYVPCGHCQDCQRVKHNEWFFRALMEWNYYRSIGGTVYFITLTYNDDDLPYYTLPDGTQIKCFDKRHIHNFIKYLRIYLARLHLEHKGIKYLICSEYSDVNTKRPHYHGLLFFPYHIPCVGRNSLFTRLMETCWQHGFIVCSKFGWQIQSAKGIRYASKYVCKDIGYYNDNLKNYLSVLDVDERRKRVSDIRPFLPRHWQSVGFGSPFFDVINNHKDIARFLFRDTYTLNIDKSPDFRIPRYYHLKFEKSVSKDISKILDKVVYFTTPVGRDVRRLRISRLIDLSIMRLRDLLSFSYLESTFPSLHSYSVAVNWFRRTYPNDATHDFLFNSYESARKQTIYYIRDNLPKFDLRTFVCYQQFIRYLPLFEDDAPDDMLSRTGDVINNMVDSPNVPPELAAIGLCSDADFVATPLVDNEFARKQKMCCNDSYFQPYESLARALDFYSFLRNVCRDYDSWKQSDDKRKIKAWKSNKPLTYKSNVCI